MTTLLSTTNKTTPLIAIVLQKLKLRYYDIDTWRAKKGWYLVKNQTADKGFGLHPAHFVFSDSRRLNLFFFFRFLSLQSVQILVKPWEKDRCQTYAKEKAN